MDCADSTRAAGADANASADADADTPRCAAAAGLPYFCQRCGHRHQLMKNDPIKCTRCYHRILYKGRTTHSVVIEVD